MIRHGELVYITKPLIEIGMYNPKSGSDDDVIVVNCLISYCLKKCSRAK